MRLKLTILFLFLAGFLPAQKFDSLALTPPMGWNSWNTFGTDISAQLVMDIADALARTGLAAAGYQYLVLDDGWMAHERDSTGNLVPDPKKFPDGLKPVIDYVHAHGLKFGLYNCAGAKTCGGYPGSRGHEYQDARLYASLGIDYLKYDWCGGGKMNAEEAYTTMRDAMFAAKQPIVFSICEWGVNQPWNWAPPVGHLWRISGDISPCWDCLIGHGTWYSWGVLRIVDLHNDIRKAVGPGHWNDFDMLEVGNGLPLNEDRVHFALWCMMASPLMLGNDLRSIKPETLEILGNKEVIAVNQDSLGIPAFKYLDDGGIFDIWAKPLSGGDWALCFLNRTTQPYPLEFKWRDQNIGDDISKRDMGLRDTTYLIRDLMLHKDLGTTGEVLKTTVPGHDVLVLRLKKRD